MTAKGKGGDVVILQLKNATHDDTMGMFLKKLQLKSPWQTMYHRASEEIQFHDVAITIQPRRSLESKGECRRRCKWAWETFEEAFQDLKNVVRPLKGNDSFRKELDLGTHAKTKWCKNSLVNGPLR